MPTGRPPANGIMSIGEMVEMEKARTGTRLFSRNEDSEEKIRKLIATTTLELVNMPAKADLQDTKLVKEVVKAYLISCYEAGTVPSKQGISRSLGLSRQGVEQFIQRNPNHSTTEFLQVTFDALADLLSNAALSNSTNMVLSIFLLKAVFGYKEAVSLEITPNPLGADVNPEELYRRIQDSVVDIDDCE